MLRVLLFASICSLMITAGAFTASAEERASVSTRAEGDPLARDADKPLEKYPVLKHSTPVFLRAMACCCVR